MSVPSTEDEQRPDLETSRRTLTTASTAHALHDGFTDMIYVLLPVWQTEFALSYGLLGLLRGLYSGAMAGLQVWAAALAQRWGSVQVLATGTALAAIGYGLAGLTSGLVGLCLALVLSGIGSSTQHPLASAAVARAYGERSRGPLGIYNFGGDVGKAALPAVLSLLLTLLTWRASLGWMAGIGLLVAAGIALYMPRVSVALPKAQPESLLCPDQHCKLHHGADPPVQRRDIKRNAAQGIAPENPVGLQKMPPGDGLELQALALLERFSHRYAGIEQSCHPINQQDHGKPLQQVRLHQPHAV